MKCVSLFKHIWPLSRLYVKTLEANFSQSVIGPDVIIKGNIHSNGDIYLFGKVDGVVHCRSLYMTEESTAGEITPEVKVVVLAGKHLV